MISIFQSQWIHWYIFSFQWEETIKVIWGDRYLDYQEIINCFKDLVNGSLCYMIEFKDNQNQRAFYITDINVILRYSQLMRKDDFCNIGWSIHAIGHRYLWNHRTFTLYIRRSKIYLWRCVWFRYLQKSRHSYHNWFVSCQKRKRLEFNWMIKTDFESCVNNTIYILKNSDIIYGVKFSIDIMIKSRLYDVVFTPR